MSQSDNNAPEPKVLDVSTARKLFSQMIDDVYFHGKTYIVVKRNIPLVKLIKINQEEISAVSKPAPKKKHKLNNELFGLIK